MNQFELFCLIFYCLDAAWEARRDPRLAEYLSEANPFLFTDVGSADPGVYEDFCRKIAGRVPLEESYAAAAAYLDGIGNDAVKEAFAAVGEDEWLDGARAYLSSGHKGSEA